MVCISGTICIILFPCYIYNFFEDRHVLNNDDYIIVIFQELFIIDTLEETIKLLSKDKPSIFNVDLDKEASE